MWGWDARPNGAFLVVNKEDAESVRGLLKSQFESSWEEANAINAPKNVCKVIEHLKGIRPRQYLYTKNVSSDLLMYAAYWPWGTTDRVSVRISLFSEENGSLDSESTKNLVAAALAANQRHADAATAST